MADLDVLDSSDSTKIVGSSQEGVESYFVAATELNELLTYSRLNSGQMVEITCLLRDILKETRETNTLLKLIAK